MKKILLSFLALIAMVGMVNAQRAWAYDLQLTSAESSYTFAFKAMTAGTATLVFTDAVGAEVGTVDLGAVEAGANTKTLALAEIPGIGNLNWAVKMTGAAIEEVTEVTAAEDKYYYYLAQDVAANTNPESKHFGKMYVLETYAGASDGASAHSKTQTPGIYVYDPALNLENYAEGYLPSNVTTDPVATTYKHLHRMAINPTKDELAFVQSKAVKVWLANLNDLKAEATNVAAETGIKASSLCYDENGVLYVMDPFAATATIYKQVDGKFVKFVERNNWGWTDDRNAMESDGRGGLWVVQNIADLATNEDSEDMLTHINAAGEVDFYVNKTSSAELQALMPATSNRGQIGYDAKHDILALGGKGTVKLFNVTYTEDGPTLSLWKTVTLGGNNVDGLAFDYAGDLIAMSASVERFYKFALPTAENTCTTPAPKAQVVVKELPVTTYTISVTAENGTVEGAGDYEEGTEVTLTATAADGYEFVNWTENEVEVSTDAEYTFEVLADRNLVANFKKSVVTHDFYVEDVTVSEAQWSIDLAGSWNEQAFVLRLWQDNTQGFGTYAANAETGYSAQLGVKDLTPTAPGYYTDMQDGTFTFQGTMTDGTDIYEVYLKGALASSTGTGELEAKNEVYFTYEDGEWMIEAFADDETWGLMLAVSAEIDPETGENLVYGQYVTDIEAGITEEVAGTCLLYFDDFSGCYVFKGGLATPASGNIYPTLYASSLTLMTNELQTGPSWVGEFAGVDYYEVLMMAADYSWELDLHARNCTGANGTYTIDVVDEAEGAYSTFMGNTIVTGELTIEDGMYEAYVTTVDSEGNPAMSISVLAWAAAAEEYDIVITDATVTDNTSGYNIDLTGEWDGHTIKVEVCDELDTETIMANFFIDGGIANDGDQAEGTVEATVNEGVVTITGTFESGSGNVYNVTISGTLPVVEEPEVPTALDNIDSTVAPVKAIVNGQLIIIRNGVQYNAQGAVVK